MSKLFLDIHGTNPQELKLDPSSWEGLAHYRRVPVIRAALALAGTAETQTNETQNNTTAKLAGLLRTTFQRPDLAYTQSPVHPIVPARQPEAPAPTRTFTPTERTILQGIPSQRFAANVPSRSPAPVKRPFDPEGFLDDARSTRAEADRLIAEAFTKPVASTPPYLEETSPAPSIEPSSNASVTPANVAAAREQVDAIFAGTHEPFHSGAGV